MNISFIDDSKLQIEWEWYEQILSFIPQRNIIIPFNHIKAISTDKPGSSWSDIRNPGITLPGVIKAGTYYSSRGKEFWYITKNQNYLTLELTDESWQRIIITIDNNQNWAEKINHRLSIRN